MSSTSPSTMNKPPIVRSYSLAENIFSGDGSLLGSFSGWGTERILVLSTSKTPSLVSTSVQKQLSVIADTSNPTVAVMNGCCMATTSDNPHHDSNSSSSDGSSSSNNDNQHHVLNEKKHIGLNVLQSVSIAGCDLLGSCLYTAGVCASNGGKLAPICLLMVTIMLYYFRSVYNEVVTALPVNGGTYNLLLNTSSKKTAAFVSCLSILSYTATCIVSAFDAVIYLALLWPSVDIRGFTVLIIILFTIITLFGVKESSTVSVILFSIHTLTLTILVLWGFSYGCYNHFKIFHSNWETTLPVIYNSDESILLSNNNFIGSLYFGYSSALLGITGFESASNYVEDLHSPATFVSSVNWMWFLSGTFNPLISFMSMMVMPMEQIYAHPSDMLAIMAYELGGKTFKTWLCIDAVMVLCGGVLTAIVGVTGLLDRLAKDKVLPEYIASKTSWGTNHIAIISFSIGSISLFLCIYDPLDPTGIKRFGGVFAISFLSVLACFAFAAILLKLYRPNLARLVITEWWQVVFSGIAVTIGIIGNIVLTPDVFIWFLIYLSILVVVISYMFLRVDLLGFAIWMLRKVNMSIADREEIKQREQKIINAYLKQHEFDEFDVLPLLSPSSSELPIDNNNAKSSNELENDDLKQSVKEDIETTTTMPAPAITGDSTTTTSTRDNAPKSLQQLIVRSFSYKRTGSVGSGGSGVDHGSNRIGSRQGSDFFGFDIFGVSGGGNTSPSRSNQQHHKVNLTDEEVEMIEMAKKAGNIPLPRRGRRASFNELEFVDAHPIRGRMLSYCMKSLDDIVNEPFLYFAKYPDPVSLHLAMEYITNNEQSDTIYIVHFVDDRALRKQLQQESVYSTKQVEENMVLIKGLSTKLNKHMNEDDHHHDTDHCNGDNTELSLPLLRGALPPEARRLMNYVSILDSFYTYKKVHSIVVRGAFFCPSAVKTVLDHLHVRMNNVIMGIPDTEFLFPFAKISGCRLVVPDASPELRNQVMYRLTEVVRKMK